MLHFPDSDTGYYDTEERFYALDAEHEAAEEARYLEELEASHGCDFDRDPMMHPDDMDRKLAVAQRRWKRPTGYRRGL